MRRRVFLTDRRDFEHRLAGIESELAWCVDTYRAEKFLRGAEEHQKSAVESSARLSQHGRGYQRGEEIQ